MLNGRRTSRIAKSPFLSALLLFVIALAVNFYLQPNLFELRVLNSNLRIFLPAMLLAAGQAIVVIGGGVDLSVGAMVSMINAILVTVILPESSPFFVVMGLLLGCVIGIAAGSLNGLAISYMRLQPIVTTYASSFIFSGIALWVLPRPGGKMPADIPRLYRSTPGNIPFAVYITVGIILIWLLIRSIRYGQYLFAVGGKADAAYATGVPVSRVRWSTYALSGLFAALSAFALTMSTGTGDPNIGNAMTLPSIVAVVLGGISLSGGKGSVIGALLGVLILGLIRNIISFANVPTWWQTLVDALIILAALAGPGLIRLIRSRNRAMIEQAAST
ncbi:ABC transporter permease [Candidatus Leptofilum sp.]|uniref:ABC transporter permease n=1 Tax=Candidatus Leptofilum sp. TaxID=3241576 RepID=UPI003B5C9EE2